MLLIGHPTLAVISWLPTSTMSWGSSIKHMLVAGKKKESLCHLRKKKCWGCLWCKKERGNASRRWSLSLPFVPNNVLHVCLDPRTRYSNIDSSLQCFTYTTFLCWQGVKCLWVLWWMMRPRSADVRNNTDWMLWLRMISKGVCTHVAGKGMQVNKWVMKTVTW